MSIDEIINQLENLRDNSRDFREEPDDIWSKDIEAITETIRLLKELKDLKRKLHKLRVSISKIHIGFDMDFGASSKQKRTAIDELNNIQKKLK